MTREEKILLIYCLLRDVRLDFSTKSKVYERVNKAKSICTELGGDFEKLATECKHFKKYFPKEVDGRYFRDRFPYGYLTWNLFMDSH